MKDTMVLKRNPQAISAEVDDAIIFLHEGDGAYYSLDGVGAFVWKSLVTPLTFGDLLQQVLSEYEVSETESRQDLEDLAADLAAKGILSFDPQ